MTLDAATLDADSEGSARPVAPVVPPLIQPAKEPRIEDLVSRLGGLKAVKGESRHLLRVCCMRIE